MLVLVAEWGGVAGGGTRRFSQPITRDDNIVKRSLIAKMELNYASVW